MKKGKIIGTSTALLMGTFMGMMFAPKKGEEFRKDIKNTIEKAGKKVKKESKNIDKIDFKKALEEISKRLDNLDSEKNKKSLSKKASTIKNELDNIIKACENIKDETLVNTATKLKEQAEDKIDNLITKFNKNQD